MKKILKTVLLLALPASGKSEVRKYLAQLSPEECAEDFHMGPTAQLDDFPYVHMMRRIDDELAAQGEQRIFFHSPERPFQDPLDWGTLIQLVDEDYKDMVEKKVASPASAGMFLMERIDEAAGKTGLKPRLASLDDVTRATLAGRLEAEAREMLDEKHENYPDTLEGKTLVIEFARGGPQGSPMPIPGSFGYRYSLSQLSSEILENATVLYIWVTPEESRRKNDERADPNDPGSILHHGVPIEVMLNDYGCDDMDWLEEGSTKPGTIPVEAHGRTYHLPVGRFDNRVDKTTFIREPREQWSREDIDAVHKGLKEALDKIAGLAL